MKLYQLTLLYCLLLAGCVMGGIPDPDGWIKPPEPKERCIPIIVDGVQKGCVPESEWYEWMKRNSL